MGGKRTEREPEDLVHEVFRRYPGSALGGYLRDGACIQAAMDGRLFALEKSDGEMVLTERELDYPDLTVELNRAACEYLASSEELKDFVTRARECVNGQRPGCRMSYRVNATAPRLIMKGYLDFARGMGLM